MTSPEIAVALLLTLVGFGFSSLFSGLETGLYTLNQVRLTVRAARGEGAAMRLRAELRRSSRTLSVLLIGNNAANYLGSYGLAELLHGAGFEEWTLVAVEAAVFTPLLFVFGETLPKDLFRTNTDRWTYALSPLIVGARWLFTAIGILPLVQGFTRGLGAFLRAGDRPDDSARQRVSQLIKEGVGAGVLSLSQTALADRALGMHGEVVADVMVPWSSVATIPADADGSTREAMLRVRRYTRYPVVAPGGAILGILSWVDAAIQRDRPTRALVQPAISFDPDTPLLRGLTTLRRQRQSMAVVVDPRSRQPIGLVTLKNLVEPLTGELAAW